MCATNRCKLLPHLANLWLKFQSIPFSFAKQIADSSETCLSSSRSFFVPTNSLQQSVMSLLIANHLFTCAKVSGFVRSKTNNTPFAPLKYDFKAEENRSCRAS